MRLKLRIGIDNICFGMDDQAVKKRLGEPDKIWIEGPKENIQILFQYNELKLRLTFYPQEDNKLAYIESANYDLTLENHFILGENVENFKTKTLKIDKKKWLVEATETQEVHFIDGIWITLKSSFDQIDSIGMGVCFTKEGEYIWDAKPLKIDRIDTIFKENYEKYC